LITAGSPPQIPQRIYGVLLLSAGKERTGRKREEGMEGEAEGEKGGMKKDWKWKEGGKHVNIGTKVDISEVAYFKI